MENTGIVALDVRHAGDLLVGEVLSSCSATKRSESDDDTLISESELSDIAAQIQLTNVAFDN